MKGEGLRVAWVTTVGRQFLALSGDRKGENGRGGGGRDLKVISESLSLRDIKAVREGKRRAG